GGVGGGGGAPRCAPLGDGVCGRLPVAPPLPLLSDRLTPLEPPESVRLGPPSRAPTPLTPLPTSSSASPVTLAPLSCSVAPSRTVVPLRVSPRPLLLVTARVP